MSWSASSTSTRSNGPSSGQRRGVADLEAHRHTVVRAAFCRASATEASSASNPTTSACGKARAIAMRRPPGATPDVGHAQVRDVSAAWMSAAAGIQRVTRSLQERGPVDASLALAKRRAEVRIRDATAGAIGLRRTRSRAPPMPATICASGARWAGWSSDTSTLACSAGSAVSAVVRRRGGVSTWRSPATACCSSHSRA